MPRRRRVTTVFAIVLLAARSLSVASDGEACAAADGTDARATCWLGLAQDLAGRLDVVEQRLAADPATALAALGVVSIPDEAAPADRAWHAELRARALQALDRADEAARAWEEALAIDDGVDRLVWLEPRKWTVDLDVGDGRLTRAARGLLAAGRPERARALAARALLLGDRAAAVEVWAAAGGEALPVAPAARFAAIPWREFLPALELPMYGGKRFSFAAARGKVVVIDFWASWCQPCVLELPFLEELYRELKPAGLEVVAVNYQEPPDAAMAFVQSIGLSLPIAIATGEADRHFKITAMPTVIVADRDGGVRARWSGYEEDVRRQIRETVEALLAEQRVEAPPLGEVYAGEGDLEVAWVRSAREPILGVGIVTAAAGGRRVAAALNEYVDLFHPSGQLDARIRVPPGVGRIVSADYDGDGTAEVVSYRKGGRSVISFEADGSAMEWLEAPAPVFAVAPFPVEDAPERLLLATLEGVIASSRDGAGRRVFGTAGPASDVAWTPEGPWVIETAGRITRLDRSGAARGEPATVPGAWSLVRSPIAADGFGVTGFGASAVAVGRFLGGATRQAAFALSSDQLVLVDVDRAAVVFRASVTDGIAGLDGGDLDGDGIDELLLAAGERIALLRCASCTAPVAGAAAAASAGETD